MYKYRTILETELRDEWGLGFTTIRLESDIRNYII